jgi:DnaJ-class molecular chaperone
MSLIEHCECFACHGTGKFEPCADEDRPALTCAECDGKGWLEHVPASQLRGAVEENERLKRDLASLTDYGQSIEQDRERLRGEVARLAASGGR